jgi:hypothetical protein
VFCDEQLPELTGAARDFAVAVVESWAGTLDDLRAVAEAVFRA